MSWSRRLIAAAGLAASAALLPGCLQRTLSITTDPPGAVVWLNDVEVGSTPLETDFTYYGAYDVRIRRAGYEPVTATQHMSPPIYERPVIDLVAEAIPAKIENRVEWHFVLEPAIESRLGTAASERAVIDRALELRRDLQP